MTPQERIKADAEAYANGVGDVYRKYASLYGYIAGATAEQQRAQGGVDLLQKMVDEFIGASEMSDKDYDKQLIKKAKTFLEQWKGKEVKRPCPHCGKELIRDRNLCCRECGKEVDAQPDLGICVECKTRPATTDYNGHGHYVCKLCDDSLTREFDEEYR